MLGALKRRWKTQRRPPLEDHDTDEERQDGMVPPRFIDVQHGKIYLGPPKQLDTVKDKELLEMRIAELEDALLRLQDQVNKSQCTSPVVEKELKEQLESMNRAMRTKDRRSLQVCREHKTLQARFVRQENNLAMLQYENKSLHQRVRQYEVCLDDVMRKVVDAIVAEDNLREEVSMLKTRVRDLEAQNAALSASPAKGRDEGYCTMSSGQPPPSSDGHLENLPEEPEQWLLSAEPCSAEMEDWSMSQDEMGTAIEEDNSEWIWNSTNLMTVNADTQTEEDFNDLLLEQLAYSDDEEIVCKNFTRDFYKLVNIHKSDSTKSLQSHLNDNNENAESTDDESNTSSSGGNRHSIGSPTPSEKGRALVFSCSSTSDSGDSCSVIANHHITNEDDEIDKNDIVVIDAKKYDVLETVVDDSSCNNESTVVDVRRTSCSRSNSRRLYGEAATAKVQPSLSWGRSNGWTLFKGQSKDTDNIEKTVDYKGSKPIAPVRSLPPPTPMKRSLGAS